MATIQVAKVTDTSVTKPALTRGEVQLIQKKQPFYIWRCNWKDGRKRCVEGKDGKPLRTHGPELGIVERNADRHWEKHLREKAEAA